MPRLDDVEGVLVDGQAHEEDDRRDAPRRDDARDRREEPRGGQETCKNG